MFSQEVEVESQEPKDGISPQNSSNIIVLHCSEEIALDDHLNLSNQDNSKALDQEEQVYQLLEAEDAKGECCVAVQSSQSSGPSPANLANSSHSKQGQECTGEREGLFIIAIEQFYLSVDSQAIHQTFDKTSDWELFASRCTAKENDNYPIIFIELNSILGLGLSRNSHLQARKILWQAAISRVEASVSVAVSQTEASGRMGSIHKKYLSQVRKNVARMLQKLKISCDAELRDFVNNRNQISCLLSDLSSHQLVGLLQDIIIQYLLYDDEIVLLKGLEYIAFGVIVSFPGCQFDADTSKWLHRMFMHFMIGLGLRKLFSNGSSLIFSENQKLVEGIKSEAHVLYVELQTANTDWNKLFTSYYKSVLMNKIENIEIMIKIFDLILVYGIKVVRIVLCKILAARELEILSIYLEEELRKYLGTQIFVDFMAVQEKKYRNGQFRDSVGKEIGEEDADHPVFKESEHLSWVNQVIKRLFLGL